MRRFLLLVCFLSVLGGCLASASHGVCVPKLISYSGKQQSSSKHISKSSERLSIKADSSAVADEDDNDIEDDDHGGNFLFKKFKAIAKYVTAYHRFVSINSLKRCNRTLAAIHGSSSRKYIAQMVLRV